MGKTFKHIRKKKIKQGDEEYQRDNPRGKFNRRKVEMPTEAIILKNAPIVQQGTFQKIASWLGF